MLKDEELMVEQKKYRAPALTKGLAILELLSSATEPLTLSGMSDRLSRSRSEIFRMVQELETHGYISKSDRGEGYELTNKLFLMGMERPRLTNLLNAALPVMRDYSASTMQSCHLAVLSGTQFVVVARNEAPGPVTFSVRIGYRQSIAKATSGMVLYASQPEREQQKLLVSLREEDPTISPEDLQQAISDIRSKGYIMRESRFIRGVTDLGAPILRAGGATAALTSPCLTRIDDAEVKTLPVEELLACAKVISHLLVPTNSGN